MLKNRIIPCLDVKNGRVVKGINFLDLKDAGDPVEQAKIYSDGGADEICFLDITASNENRDTIYEVVEKTSKKCFVPLTVGGGVRSIEDINKLLNCGADKVSINTAAVQNSELVVESFKKFGSQCIVVAIDAKQSGDKWEVFTHGGRNNTGIDALEFSKKMLNKGAVPGCHTKTCFDAVTSPNGNYSFGVEKGEALTKSFKFDGREIDITQQQYIVRDKNTGAEIFNSSDDGLPKTLFDNAEDLEALENVVKYNLNFDEIPSGSNVKKSLNIDLGGGQSVEVELWFNNGVLKTWYPKL